MGVKLGGNEKNRVRGRDVNYRVYVHRLRSCVIATGKTSPRGQTGHVRLSSLLAGHI